MRSSDFLVSASLLTFVLFACGDDPSQGGAPAAPFTPSGGIGSDGGSSSDGAAPTDPDAAAPPATSCARALVSKTAPVALFDAFKTEIATLAGPARTARVDKLLADVAAQGGAPLEDPASGRVIFLARGAAPAGPWKVGGSFSGWDTATALPLVATADTDLWSVETTVPRGNSFEYKLVSGEFREDPLARNVVWDGIDRGFGVAGELNGIGHPGDAPSDRSRMIALGKVHAQKLANDRDVWIQYPAGYDDASCKKLPSIVIHDGLESLTRGGFAKEADKLYAARPDLAAVLVFVGLPSPEVRMGEYTIVSPGAKGADYIDFLASDLWPLVTKQSRLCGKPAARGISGASLGGLISTFGAFERPDQWGWIGAQSASYFWADSVMITRVTNAPKQPLRIYLDSGCPNDNCVVTDELAAVLQQKGYDHVRIKQDGAAHDWSFWRERFAGMLTHFRNAQTVCD